MFCPSSSISKNVTWSVRKKFEEGTPVFMYKRFLGYKKGADGGPEIVPSEAAIVERIFNLYLAGETVDKISKMMQAENYDIPGKTISFSKGMIMNMLSNERYCGEAPMYYVQNNHPAIPHTVHRPYRLPHYNDSKGASVEHSLPASYLLP